MHKENHKREKIHKETCVLCFWHILLFHMIMILVNLLPLVLWILDQGTVPPHRVNFKFLCTTLFEFMTQYLEIHPSKLYRWCHIVLLTYTLSLSLLQQLANNLTTLMRCIAMVGLWAYIIIIIIIEQGLVYKDCDHNLCA